MEIGGEGAAAILEHGDIAVLVLGPEHFEIRAATPAARRLTAGRPGSRFPDLVAQGEEAAVACFLRAVTPDQPARMTCAIPVAEGPARTVELTVRDLTGVPGIAGLVATLSDVSWWVAREELLYQSAAVDVLTGLGTRPQAIDRLERAVRSGRDQPLSPAVLVVDLDDFEQVNDQLGRARADRVLVEMAERIVGVIGDAGSAFRMGGDEFVVIIDATDPQSALLTAERLLAAVRRPVTGEGPPVVVTASVGVCAQPDIRADRLLDAAGNALDRARASGRDRALLYDSGHSDWMLARKLQVEELEIRLEQLNREKDALAAAARIDPRTGLPNAATFDTDHRLLQAHSLPGGGYSLLLIDLDRFHEYNHRYLYLAGNRALRSVAATVNACLRDGDRAYRWGGEEIAVLLPQTTLDGALVVAERIRAAVEDLGIEHLGNPAASVVTVTIGAVEAAPGQGADEVFERASALLAEGKDAGRNRVVAERRA